MKLLKVLYILLISSFSSTLAHTEIKAVIFDFDGTLIHTGIGYFLGWQYAFQRHGYELNSDEFWDFMNQNNLVGSPKADEITIRYFSELLGRDCSQEIYRDKQMFSHKFHESSEFPPIEATVNFLHALGKAKEELGLKIGLASANRKNYILRGLKRLNVDHYFDVIISCDDLRGYSDPEGVNKPKPYIYQEAAKQLRLNPSQCVAIEDSHAGLTSAVSAGYTVIAVPNAYTEKQDLSKAHLKVNSFVDVTPTQFLQMISN